MATSAAHIDYSEGAAPSTPAASKVRLYAKTDGLLYSKDDVGTETLVSGGAGGAGLGTWTAYTPSLTAVTTNPTLGSSTISGRYMELDANTLAFTIYLAVTTGGAWNAGSGEWKFSLPAGMTSANIPQVVSVHMLDSGTRRYAGTGLIAASATVIWPIAIADASGTFILSNSVPVTWATGDTVAITGLIELT